MLVLEYLPGAEPGFSKRGGAHPKPGLGESQIFLGKHHFVGTKKREREVSPDVGSGNWYMRLCTFTQTDSLKHLCAILVVTIPVFNIQGVTK